MSSFAQANRTSISFLLSALVHIVIEAVKPIYPYLLASNLNRVVPPSFGRVVANGPLEQAWMVVGLYIVTFIGLAIFIFARRDITD